MSLASVAWVLAKDYNLNVLVIDWDLEAPGIHRFFDIKNDNIDFGLIDLFYEYKKLLTSDEPIKEDELINLDKYVLPNIEKFKGGGSISLLPSGRFDSDYASKVNDFDWQDLYENWQGFNFIEYLKNEIKKKYYICLIDSRTGTTDIGGICTIQIPDAVVMLFALNEQNIEGIKNIAHNINEISPNYRVEKNPPQLIVLPSRVEQAAEGNLLIKWQQNASEKLFDYLPVENQNDALTYIISQSIPYKPEYGFGEEIPPQKDPKRMVGKELVNLTKYIFEECNLSKPGEDLSIIEVLEEKLGKGFVKCRTDNHNNIIELDISNANIEELTKEIFQLKNLRSLNISNNLITRIPDLIQKLESLISLNCSNNKIKTLPDSLFLLTNMKELDISHNAIEKISEQIVNLHSLCVFNCVNNLLVDPPYEVASKGIESLQEYYRQLNETGSDYINEANLFILGEAGVGKTSLAKKIENTDWILQQDQSPTKGINNLKWIIKSDDGEILRVNIWDFGGQPIYHETHQLFLTNRSLFLLVIDSRNEDNDLNYWLNTIKLFSADSPILIIKNEKSDRKVDINESVLHKEFTNFKNSFSTNLENNRGLSEIINAIKSNIQKLPHIGIIIPKTWKNVREILNSDNRNYISLDEFLTICDKNGLTGKRDQLFFSQFLQDLGVIIHFQEDSILSEFVILNPIWCINTMYKVLDHKYLLANKGHFAFAELKEIWSEPKLHNKYLELLQLMKNFMLCYEIPSSDKKYIVPQLLSREQPDYNWNYQDNLQLKYSYEFMPKGIITQFIISMHNYIVNQALVWREGVVLESEGNRAEIIEEQGKGELSIKVSGHGRKELYTEVIFILDEIHNSYSRLKYNKLLPCKCVVCLKSKSPTFYKYDDLMRFRENYKELQCPKSYEMVRVYDLIDDLSRIEKTILKATNDQSKNIMYNELYLNVNQKEKLSVFPENYTEVHSKRSSNYMTLSENGANTFVSYGIKKGIGWITKENRYKLQSIFTEIIDNTIEEYSRANPVADFDDKLLFYQSKIFLVELLKHRFFCKAGYKTNEIILSELKNNDKIKVPEKEQIHDFFNIFEKNIEADEELKKLAFGENYQEEIFTISDNVFDLFNLSKAIKVDTSEIKKDTKIIIDKLDDAIAGSDNSYPKELTALVRIPKKDIVGREIDLQNLRESLMQNHDTALINGMGGIGKTTLAAVYLTEFYDEYDHIVLLTIENSLEEAIIANTSLIKNLKIAEEELSEPLISCLNKLRTLQSKKPKLLIIDNAHESLAEHFDMLPKAPEWHLLVTSRERIENFKIIDLDFLPEDEAIELFNKYHSSFSTKEIRSIVKGVELHTLTIEILAKSAHRNHWKYETVRSAFTKDAKAGIKVKHNVNKIAKIDRIKSYITSIFDISGLSEQEVYLLKQFSALPNQWIDFEFLSRLLDKNKLDWSDEFGGMLENVCDQGFVLKDNKTDSYKMHPVLVEALIFRLDITIDDLKLLSKSVAGLLSYEQSNDNPIDKFRFIPFGEALLKQLRGDHTDITASLQSNLAMVYIELGQFEKARELLEQALQTNIEKHGEKHSSVATSQSNLAMIYKDLGEFEKARELLEQALRTGIEISGEKHPSVAIDKFNLALIYQELCHLEKARDLLEQALHLDIENYGDKHPTVAIRQSNLALVYRDLGEYEKARELLELALQTSFENFGDKHPSMASSQSNLALVYKDLGEYEKARELLEQVLQTDIKNYGDRHPAVAIRQSNLALLYQALGQLEKARELWKRAYDILLSVFGEKHPHTQTVKKFLQEISFR